MWFHEPGAWGQPGPASGRVNAPWVIVTLARVVVDGIVEESRLAILRYVRDHEGAAAAAVARDVFEAPRTTFGRPLRMRRAAGELGVLVELGLLAPVGSGRRSIFRLTEAGRRMLRSATLGPVLGDTGAGI